MNEETLQRIRCLYEGEFGRRWERIEIGRPATYLEQNIQLGRGKLQARLLEWLGPLRGLRILDAGCGLGSFAHTLAERGGRVTGADLVPRFMESARARTEGDAPAFLANNFLELLPPGSAEVPFDVVLLVEVLEDYSSRERIRLLQRVADSAVPRIYLAFRSGDEGSRLWNLLPSTGQRRISSPELLRWVHTHTPYRQTRQEITQIRNYQAQLSELVRTDGG